MLFAALLSAGGFRFWFASAVLTALLKNSSITNTIINFCIYTQKKLRLKQQREKNSLVDALLYKCIVQGKKLG
jgi:hypothetical protein